MDSFTFDFNTDSTFTNDTNSSHSDLDWTTFQSTSPLPTTSSPFTPLCLSQQDDAVAPNNQSTIIKTSHDDEIYFEIEHFFNGFNQQRQQQQQAHSQSIESEQQEIIEQMHTTNINISDQTMNNKHHVESLSRTHSSLVMNERPMTCLPAPLLPRVSSLRSKYYHKLPEHAVKLMQEWYNANLDDPYPRSSDKNRFITEGNITAQQCRSWFANRRQRLKHVKRNQSKPTSSSSSSSSRLNHSLKTKFTQIQPIEAHSITYEHCYYCQQQQQQQQQITLSSSPLSLTIPTTPMTTTTTLNVVINQQTVEQLIHNSLRKLFCPALI
ncbi:unnamed protein product [Rotaria sordida]|uniref:Homeobox domain-containing protein n=1 Tax=Rotaria sordida TaxID=392033 RepID=A0A814RGU3_9BILA|nr:unnamed protein product [Rotaria sordida]